MSMQEAEITGASTALPVDEAAFNDAMSFGIGESVTVPPATPLPAAGAEGDAAAKERVETGAESQNDKTGTELDPKPDDDAAKAAAAAGGAGAEGDAATLADPELTAAQNALVQSAPAAEQPALAAQLKRAHFIDYFLDPATERSAVVDKLIEKSPAQFTGLADEIVRRRFEDPVKGLGEIYARDKDLYGKIALATYNADKPFFNKLASGRDSVDTERIQTALDFYDTNKDRIPAEGDAGKAIFTKEELDSIKEYQGEEAYAKANAANEAALKPATPPAPVKDEKTEAELKELREFKAKQDQVEKEKQNGQISQQQAEAKEKFEQTYAAGYNVVDSYVRRRLDDDGENGFGLKVTDEERKLAPEVADLKDIKRSLILKGAGERGDFEHAFGEWGQTQEDFKKAGAAMGFYSARYEKQNTIEAANKLVPFADTYLNQLAADPLVKRIDGLIAEAIVRNGKKPRVETFVPGAAAAVAGGASDDPVDFLNNHGINR